MKYKKFFAIHRSVEDHNPAGWDLSHLPSGKSIWRGIPSIAKAKQIINKLIKIKVFWGDETPDYQNKISLIRDILGIDSPYKIREKPVFSFWKSKYLLFQGTRYLVPCDEEIMQMDRSGNHYSLKWNRCDPDARTTPDGTPSWYCALGIY